jgi:hypothetical protein
MRRLWVLVVTASLAAVMLVPSTALAGANKVTVCHLDRDLGTWQAIRVSANGNAVQAHLNHGDAFPGGRVPRMPNHLFDEDCVPVALFAVAYSDVNPGDGGYNPPVDILIAELVDYNRDGVANAGDRIKTAHYPTALDASTFGDFGVTAFDVTSVFGTATRCSVAASDLAGAPARQFVWEDEAEFEYYLETPGIGYLTSFVDEFTDLGDAIDVQMTQSVPADDGLFAAAPSPGDDQFIDVELNCT